MARVREHFLSTCLRVIRDVFVLAAGVRGGKLYTQVHIYVCVYALFFFFFSYIFLSERVKDLRVFAGKLKDINAVTNCVLRIEKWNLITYDSVLREIIFRWNNNFKYDNKFLYEKKKIKPSKFQKH